MSSAMLPHEALPVFYRNCIYPWAPQHYIVESMRRIMYMGDGAWNSGSLALVIIGLVGVVLLCVKGVMPLTKRRVLA